MGLILAAACFLGTAVSIADSDEQESLITVGLPAPVEIPYAGENADLNIDGKLIEKLWDSSARIHGLQLSKGEGSESGNTLIRLAYDQAALYIGWEISDQDIRATMTDRDSRFWEEEVVEVFLTAGSLNEYFELQWNPLGGVFDAIIRNRLQGDGSSESIDGDWSWTAEGMSHAVQLKGTPMDTTDADEGWIVEVRIPFSDLRLDTPDPGDVWRGNFFRMNRDEGGNTEGLCWSPVFQSSFHQPVRFGYLIFGNRNERSGGTEND